MTSDEKSKKEQHDLTVDMLLRKKLYMPGLHILARCALGILLLIAIVLRVSLYRVVSSDYTFFLSQWYDFIQTQIVNLAYVAFAVLVITVITTADLILTLYPNIRKKQPFKQVHENFPIFLQYASHNFLLL